MSNYQNNYYIPKSLQQGFTTNPEVFSYDGIQILEHKSLDFKFNLAFTNQNQSQNQLNVDFEEFCKTNIDPIFKKISQQNWQGDLTRDEVLKLAKFYLINYLRNPSWLKLLANDEKRWHKAISEALNLDIKKQIIIQLTTMIFKYLWLHSDLWRRQFLTFIIWTNQSLFSHQQT
ncbi:hypothetical protein SCLARK_00859 [Spiroplasma clarkii]|uniref:hypothetical protein n=1 Tax=Spiroplasma clarkii TaxID=2139 RepID=UPI000B5773BD|nr:hypothetical protein [Spiroplasma clarkii]ARU91472.1 hypothetical protein SCLARK_00859 [Spiroplasma clarkii]